MRISPRLPPSNGAPSPRRHSSSSPASRYSALARTLAVVGWITRMRRSRHSSRSMLSVVSIMRATALSRGAKSSSSRLTTTRGDTSTASVL